MNVRHVGQKPKHKLIEIKEESKKRKFKYYEKYPDDHKLEGRYWTKRQLLGGCDGESKRKVKNGMIYCDHCNEWFTVKDFE